MRLQGSTRDEGAPEASVGSDATWLRAAAALTVLAFAAWGVLQNDGATVFPLDDAYIHLQYARAWVEGHPFAYQAGEPAGTGATSLLWPLLLAPAAAVGSDPLWVAWAWGLALGTLGFVLAVDGVHRYLLADAPDDPTRARVGAVILLGFGPLVWTAASGMEGALAAGALAQTLAALRIRDARTPTDPPAARSSISWAAFAWASLLVTLRPEGLLLVGLMAFSDLARARRGSLGPRPLDGTSLRRHAGWLAPLALGAVQPVLNVVLSGQTMGTSGLAKLHRINDFVPGNAARTLWSDFVVGAWGSHISQGFGVAVPLVILVGAVRMLPRARGGLLLALWLAPMCLLAVELPIAWHHARYLHPLAPVAALLAADAVAAGLAWCGAAARPAAWVLAGAWCLGGLTWTDLLARNMSDIAAQHVALGRWVARNFPADATIAAGDVGALAWFGERRVIDMEGIISPGMLRHAAAGEGSLYAHLRTLRPTHAIYYADVWYPEIAASRLFTERFRVVRTERTIAGANAMTVADVNAAVWDSAAFPPVLTQGERVCDVVDVAALDSEGAHGWEELPGTRALGVPTENVPSLLLRLAAPVGTTQLVDDARRVYGAEAFRVPCGNARGGRIVGRFAPADGPGTLLVAIGGQAFGRLEIPAGTPRWIDMSLDLPPDYAGEEIVVVPQDGIPGDGGGRVVARWMRVVSTTLP